MKKKSIILVIAIILAFALTACADKDVAPSSENGGDTSSISSKEDDDTNSGSSKEEDDTNKDEAETKPVSLEPYTPVDPASVPANAESDFIFEVTEYGFTYITKYIGTATQVRIPDTLGGSSEFRIAKEAFEQNETITYVYIPDHVSSDEASFLDCTALEEVYIGGHIQLGVPSFRGCTALRRVEMGEGIDVLRIYKSDSGAFEGCTSLTEVIFPATIEYIGECSFSECENLEFVDLSHTSLSLLGEKAFADCSRLTEVLLPATLKGGEFSGLFSTAFLRCPSLSKVTIDPSNPNLTLEDGIIYSGTELVCKIEGMGGEDVVVRDGTTKIRFSAFKEQTNLRSVTFPDSLKEIDEQAFNSCAGLKTVNFGNGLEVIKQYAFNRCEALEEVVLPKTAIKLGLGGSAFAYCRSLKKVVLPDQVEFLFGESIDKYTFCLCDDAIFTFRGVEYTYDQAAELTSAINNN